MFLKQVLGISYFGGVWAVVDWEELKPEERVDLAVGMSDVVVRVCAEGVRAQYPDISEEELVEKVRERLMFDDRRGRGV